MDSRPDAGDDAAPAPPLAAASLTTTAIIVIVGIIADQVTKIWAVSALGDGRSIAILPTLEFDLHYNSGFSFGTGAGSGRLIGIVVIVMVVYLANMLRREASPRRAAILAIILSGAIGNLLDRILRADDGFLSGDVVDFIDVSWFAIFNVADIFVVGGVLLFALFELTGGDRSGAGEGGEEPGGQTPVTVDGELPEVGSTKDEPE